MAEMKQTPAHNFVNNELLAFVPREARRIVEVGCMVGSMAQVVRQRQPQVHYTGIDIDPDYARVAAHHCTEALAGDIEKFEPAAFDKLFPSDCWIFGDCLEHLRDPWGLLGRIRTAIDPDGCLLACIPNAQHWSVQRRLATGLFRYEEEGLMDRTHIRWFTRITMLEMFQNAGWKMEHGMARFAEVPGEARHLAAIRAMAEAGGFDAERAVEDARPYQYVFKMVPA